MGFKEDIENFSKKTVRATTLIIRGTALDLSASIFKRTPVDTGRLRGNWQTEINGFPTDDVDTKPSVAISQNARVVKTAKVTDSIFLVNNLPYAGVMERGGSEQAPNGMVAVTIRAFKRTVDKNARANR